MEKLENIAVNLIGRRSITPYDEGCQDYIIKLLTPYGFIPEVMQFNDVTNLWLRRGQESPLFVFAGHTDVVPPGSEKKWTNPPFSPKIINGTLYGRGAADMKGSLAAMVTACQKFVTLYPEHSGSIALLLTSDEEGPATNGTKRVIETLCARDEHINWCIVGEPTSAVKVGDTIKNGRRGSLSGTLTVYGTQGHVAYPHLADNPIHRISNIITELSQYKWDNGNRYFPATTFQVSNLSGGVGASNVIPGSANSQFNLRFCPDTTVESIKATINSICKNYAEHYDLSWKPIGIPYQTSPGLLTDVLKNSIQEITGHGTQVSTDGGTSDGRFIATSGAEVIELGPVNKTIHQIDECVDILQLETLSHIYQSIITNLLTDI